MTQPARQQPSGISLTQRILGVCLLLIALVIIVLVGLSARQFAISIQDQADALGETLVIHTAQAVSAPLALSDSLGLAAVLRELTENPYVAHAALYSVDNRTLAEAGRRPKPGKINSLYTRPIAFEHVIAGQLHVNIDVKRLQKPLYANLQGLMLLGILLLLACVMLLSRAARSICQPLTDLQRWLIQPVGQAPHQQRGDEIGLLARTLEQCFRLPGSTLPIDSTLPDEAETGQPQPDHIIDTSQQDTAAVTAQAVLPEQCAVLAVELSLGHGIYELDEQRREQLLDHYDQALEEVADIYQGRLLELADGQSMLLFHDDAENHLANALCAAELLRAFAHALQMEIADSGITLGMQLGVAHGDAVFDFGEEKLLQHAAIAEALELARYSRNLVLLGQSVTGHPQTFCASIRSIARPAGASCIERILPPCSEQLDMQLQSLMLLVAEA